VWVLVLVAVVAGLFLVRTEKAEVQTREVVAPLSDHDALEVGDGGHVVVVREAAATEFHVSFEWPIGFRDDPQICHALHAWWSRSASRREADMTRGMELTDPTCGWTQVSLDLSAPATELSTVVPMWFDDLERGPGLAPAPGAAPNQNEQIQAFVTWAGITSAVRGDAVVQHALFGPRDRKEWFPTRSDPDESAAVASLRRLARMPVDVRYAGPHDLATVTQAVARDRDERPAVPVLQLDARRADVYLWTDERMAIDILVTAGAYDADEEALYALFTHWTRSRIDAATAYLPRADKEYGVITTFEPSLWASGQNFVQIHVYKRHKRPLDVPRLLTAIRGVFTSTSMTDDEWRALVDAIRAEAARSDPDGLTRARRVGDGMRRGLVGDPDEIVLQQLPTVLKGDFEDYLRQVAGGVITVVAGGADGVTVTDFPPEAEVVSVASKP
jgi:hypothetical protein